MRALVMLVLAGCYAPSPATGIPCGTGPKPCPGSLVCAPATHTCETTSGDVIDAAIDAFIPAVDAAVCAATTTHDEDGDGVVDNCDNCPGIANGNQADTTEGSPDGVGDACDPHPLARDRIAFFESFATMPQGWQIDPTATVANDKLRQVAAAGYGEAYSNKTSTAGVVETRYTITELASAPPYSSVEVVAEVGNTGVEGYRCGWFQGASGGRGVAMQIFIDPYDIGPSGTVGGPRFAIGQTALLTFAFGGTLACKASSPDDKVSVTEPEARTGAVGVGTQNVGAAFDYLVLYEPVP